MTVITACNVHAILLAKLTPVWSLYNKLTQSAAVISDAATGPLLARMMIVGCCDRYVTDIVPWALQSPSWAASQPSWPHTHQVSSPARAILTSAQTCCGNLAHVLCIRFSMILAWLPNTAIIQQTHANFVRIICLRTTFGLT